MNGIKKRFTKWYIKRGYTFEYDFAGVPIYSDEFIRVPGDTPRSIFNCPFWIKPLLVFFSPSVYYVETFGKMAIEGFRRGLRS